MARYQLFRTSPSLSGQVRLDIIVNKDEDTQKISGDEIHIVPIRDNIDFNESNKRPALNYSHRENIKNLYREISEDFYSTEGEYTEKSWLYDGVARKDPHSHTYMAGPKRMRYTRYGKQFSYMIPIWISEYTDFSKIRLVCHAGSEDHDVILSSFRLSPDIAGYLQKYMDDSATGECVSDNLLNVDLENMNSYIQGVQADTGQYMTRDTSYIMDFILKRERPMLELDSALLDLFRQNNMIAQQILNLNFVFNIKDISGAWPEYYLYNKQVRIWIDVQYENKSLEYKDLYTNYQFIPKYNLQTGGYTRDNVLDFMEDYDCIDLVEANKFTQPVFHWTLVNNPNYIFNLYSGCSPYLENGMILEGGSFNWVDISLDEADPWKQNWKWIKFADKTGVANWRSDYDDNMSAGHPEYRFSKIIFNSGSLAIESNLFRKYFNDNDEAAWSDMMENLKSKNIWLTMILNTNQVAKYEFNFSTPGDNICIFIKCNNLDSMVLYKMCHNEDLPNIIENIPDGYDNVSADDMDLIKNLLRYIIGRNDASDKNMWDRWIRPNLVEFDNVMDIYREDKTMAGQSALEFKYVEPEDIRYDYMYRYSGNLCPIFIDPEDPIFYNQYYRYYQWDNKRSDVMRECAILKNKRIPMKYPSIILGEDHGCNITYFPWIEGGDTGSSPFYVDWNTDMIWGRHNTLWNLPPTVMFRKEMPKNMSPEDIDNEIWNGFIEALRDMSSAQDCPLADVIEIHQPEFREYVNMNYKIIQNFEYKSLTDINNIIYTITYKLR